MYKIRLREWGLRKNRRKNPASTAAAAAAAATTATTTASTASTPSATTSAAASASTPSSTSSSSSASSPQPQPQPQPASYSSSSKEKQPQQRQPHPRQAPTAAETQALARHIMSPDELRNTEHLMYALREYVQCASLTQSWTEDLANPVGARDPSLRWLTRMFCASRLLSRGQTGPAFRAIDACCAEYRVISPSVHPGLFPAMVNALFCLESVDPVLAQSFLAYAQNLGDAIFPPTHPVQALAGAFIRMGLVGLKNYARLILEGYKAAVQGSVGRHRGPVGRDISTHLLAYQGCAEFAVDLVRGRGFMETALEHWPKWFKVSLDTCDPAFLPMVEAFENVVLMSLEDDSGNERAAALGNKQQQQQQQYQRQQQKQKQQQQQRQSKQRKWTRDQVTQQWETLAEEIVNSTV